jgi:hypothetical protein
MAKDETNINTNNGKRKIIGFCRICKKEFHAETFKKRYCSNACKQVAYRRHHFMYRNQQEEIMDYDTLIQEYKNLSMHYLNMKKTLEDSEQTRRDLSMQLKEALQLLKELHISKLNP